MHSYSSIHLHVVFATWSRRRLLGAELRPRVHAWIASTARNLGITDVHVGGWEDHVHLLGRFDPAQAPSALIGQIKQASSSWLGQTEIPGFRWQRGFGAFSVSRDRVPRVMRYIQRQEEHHRRRTFQEELEAILAEHGTDIGAVHLL